MRHAIGMGLAAFLVASAPASALTLQAPGTVYKQLQHIPAGALPTPDGELIDLADHRGKVRVVTFFSAYTAESRTQVARLVALQRRYEGRGFQAFAVSLEKAEDLKAYAAQAGMNYPALVGDKATLETWGGLGRMPTSFVIGRKGYVYQHFEGLPPAGVLEKAVGDLL